MMNVRTKKVLTVLIASVLLISMTVEGLQSLKGNTDTAVNVNNVAGTYTQYMKEYGICWATGMIGVIKKYKDVYTTKSTQLSNVFNARYQFVDEWNGPTDTTRTETLTAGTSRTTSFSAGVEAEAFRAAASHSITASESTTVSKTFTFPGDYNTHTLYVTRRQINTKGYTSRTSYISRPSYNYIWGLWIWNVSWSAYTRYYSRDFATRYACDTLENQYGNQMT